MKSDKSSEEPASLEVAAEEEEETGIGFQYETWLAERKAVAADLVKSGRRTWAAMAGWSRISSQEEWEALRDQTVEDWHSGAALLRMLGGERYIEPERAALCLMLWADFCRTYQPEGSAEHLVVAMAVLSFDHFLRINELAHNLQARLEHDFFSLEPLRSTNDGRRSPYDRGGLEAEKVAAQLGNEALVWLDRLNRMVLRNLRALRELRSATSALTVANYGQLNVAHTQTNQAQPRGPARRSRVKQADATGANTEE